MHYAVITTIKGLANTTTTSLSSTMGITQRGVSRPRSQHLTRSPFLLQLLFQPWDLALLPLLSPSINTLPGTNCRIIVCHLVSLYIDTSAFQAFSVSKSWTFLDLPLAFLLLLMKMTNCSPPILTISSGWDVGNLHFREEREQCWLHTYPR